jgi:hypothetical protein
LSVTLGQLKAIDNIPSEKQWAHPMPSASLAEALALSNVIAYMAQQNLMAHSELSTTCF